MKNLKCRKCKLVGRFWEKPDNRVMCKMCGEEQPLPSSTVDIATLSVDADTIPPIIIWA